MHRPCGSFLLFVASSLGCGCIVTEPSQAFAQQGNLQTIRDDVRNGPPPSPPSSGSPAGSSASNAVGDVINDTLADNDGIAELAVAGVIAGAVAASPFFGPRRGVGGAGGERFFHHYPYQDNSGYMPIFELQDEKSWAVQVEADYSNNFDRMDSVGGSVLFETTSRFGFELQGHQLQERLPEGASDRLWLGDANLLYRFAQSDWAEFRAGLGINWLDDSQDTNLGFNFTYSADIFPHKPWVLSSTIDAGTLGHAGLFRFRTTAGVVVHGVEAFTGYEYLDIEPHPFELSDCRRAALVLRSSLF